MVMNLECWYCNDDEEKCAKGYSLDWCDDNCPIFKSMTACFSKSGLEKKYWYPVPMHNVSVDSNAIKQITQIKDGLDDFVADGKILLLQSDKCGNGKTSWGIKLLQKQIEHNCKNAVYSWPPAYFVYIPTLLLLARRTISSKDNSFSTMETLIENSPLVMFDDIGAIPLKDYDQLLISHYIETRINKGLSCIFTTNCSQQSLKANLGERLFDRIYGLSQVITFKASSMRGRNE